MYAIRRTLEVGTLLGCAAFVASATISPALAETLTIHGSTTFNSRLIEPYGTQIEVAAKHKLVVVANKSSLGLLALFEKRADLAMISTGLEGEIAFLRKERPDLPYERLHAFEVSRTRVAFAVHPTNVVRSTPRETMQRVLLGELKNWRQLGGADLPIRVVMVRDGGGVQTSVETQLLQNKNINVDNPIRVHISSQVVRMVEQETGALGLSQLGVLRKSKVSELVLDPPVVQVLSLVTLDEPNAAVQGVIDAARKVASARLEQ